MLLICHVTLHPTCLNVYLRLEWRSITLIPQAAKFNDFRYCGSGDVTFFNLSISQEHVIKGAFTSVSGSSSGKIIFLPSLVAISIVIVGICF